MSSEINGQNVLFVCDVCDADREIAGTFREAWEYLKEDGWRCFQDEFGTWQHRCPECVGQD
jgi:hypothetical protein